VRRLLLALTLCGGLLAAACTNIYTPTPGLATATLPPLATFTPRYTATPVPTASPRPTFTETPSPSPVPPTPSDTPTPTPTPPVLGRVSTVQDAVNMREGPGVTFPAIVGVTNNTDVVILAANEDRTWYNVRLEDGTEGWIAANLIFVLPSPTPQPTPTAPGVVVEISGTPLATALLGGLPVTATPSFTPAGQTAGSGQFPPRTPGTVSPTPTPTLTPPRGLNIPTITPLPAVTTTAGATAAAQASPARPAAGSGTPAPVVSGYDVLAYCEEFNQVPPPLGAGSTIDIFWGWIASTREYVQQHINNAIYEVRLDGRLLDNWRLFQGRITQQADGNWSVYWYVPISEPLTSGQHTITYRVSWENPIFDGYQQFGPGTAVEFESGRCTIEVR